MRCAGLVGAIADAVSEVSVGAVASYITDGASESRVGDLNHVVDACLTASRKTANILGH